MDAKTRQLIRMTSAFYAANAPSFSTTRQHPWTGWTDVARIALEEDALASLLDVACGNLRFERFLFDAGLSPARTYAVDGCAALLGSPAPSTMDIQRRELDIATLIGDGLGFADVGIPTCTLTVCFGFLHHIPTRPLRHALLQALIKATESGGVCALSFWQLEKDARLRAKAQRATERACAQYDIRLPEEQDRFLGWQDQEDSFRYCHGFTDDEVDALRWLLEDSGAAILQDFHADGACGCLNRYLVMRVR